MSDVLTQVALQAVTSPKMEKLFKSRTRSCKYVFKDGRVANFIFGRFTTKDEKQAQELETEIALGHPDIFVDPDEKEADPRLDSPEIKSRAAVIKELIQSNLLSLDPTRDLGQVAINPLNPQNTSNIASVAAGGDATQLMATLNSLNTSKK